VLDGTRQRRCHVSTGGAIRRSLGLQTRRVAWLQSGLIDVPITAVGSVDVTFRVVVIENNFIRACQHNFNCHIFKFLIIFTALYVDSSEIFSVLSFPFIVQIP
jgi:hypothetical protein